jgi:hypothetical protein
VTRERAGCCHPDRWPPPLGARRHAPCRAYVAGTSKPGQVLCALHVNADQSRVRGVPAGGRISTCRARAGGGAPVLSATRTSRPPSSMPTSPLSTYAGRWRTPSGTASGTPRTSPKRTHMENTCERTRRRPLGDGGANPVIILVPKGGLEPPHPCGHMTLNHARLPIPPLRHGSGEQQMIPPGGPAFQERHG